MGRGGDVDEGVCGLGGGVGEIMEDMDALRLLSHAHVQFPRKL